MASLMKKITLLLIGVPSAMMVSLLTSSMAHIYASYPQYDEMLVTMILTIPNLTAMVGLMATPALLKKYPIKHLVLTGLCLFIGSNLLAFWCDQFYLLLFLRALSGVGCGMILPLQVTYLAEYPEKERASLMGLGATVSCLFAAVTVAVSGMLAAKNWHLVFLLYLVNAAGLIMAVLFLPKHLSASQSTVQNPGQVQTEERLQDYKHILFFYYFMMIGCYLFCCILGSQVASYLNYYQLGGSEKSGFVMSIFQIGSMLSGFALGYYTRVFRGYTMSGLFAIGAVAFFLLGVKPSMLLVCVAAFMLGIITALASCVVSYEFSRALPISLVASASAGMSFFLFVLQFVSPMLFLALLDVIPASTYQTIFMLYAGIQLVFLLLSCTLPKVLFRHNSK